LSLSKVKLIDIPKIRDVRGNLSFIEKDLLPYTIKTVYYLYDVPSDSYRGGHAHHEQQEFLVALSGSFDVTLLDVNGEKMIITLNKPNQGLLIPKMIWRELDNFSSGSVCLVVASDVFLEQDYIRDLNYFKNYK
jgi:dTDP-4-dehydrorhamnose 3,5-epimerase-like enzyme